MKKTSVKTNTSPTLRAEPLAEHLKAQGLSVTQFARKVGLKKEDLVQADVDNGIFVIDDRLYTQATRYGDGPVQTGGEAVLFSTHIKTHFDGSLAAFSKQYGESHGFLMLAEKDGSVWLHGEIYQPVSTLSGWTARRLDAHINDVCNGNETAFARVYQTTQQQMHRWLQRDCYFCQGEIYLRRTSHSQRKLRVVERAVLLRDHIHNNYGPGNDGISLFSREYNINQQQVKRYIDYAALWIHGDVYKNQSKFAENGIKPDFSLAKRRSA